MKLNLLDLFLECLEFLLCLVEFPLRKEKSHPVNRQRHTLVADRNHFAFGFLMFVHLVFDLSSLSFVAFTT